MQWPTHVQKTTLHGSPSHPLVLIFFPHSLPQCSLDLGWEEVDINVLSMTEHLFSIL